MVLAGITAMAMVSMAALAYAGTNMLTSPGVGEQLNLPQSGAPLTKSVTHNAPTSRESKSFKWAGLTITPLNANSTDAHGIISESQALQQTDVVTEQFSGSSRNIELVKVSRYYDAAGKHAVVYTDKQTGDDKKFVNGKFENIPCYLVTIKGVNIPSVGGMPIGNESGPATVVPNKNTLVVVIDATTGANLLMYAIYE